MFYHPHRNLAVDEILVASKAKTGILQLRNQAVCHGWFKELIHSGLFNLHKQMQHPLSAWPDVVMSLLQPRYLGTGCHILCGQVIFYPQAIQGLPGRLTRKREKNKLPSDKKKSMIVRLP